MTVALTATLINHGMRWHSPCYALAPGSNASEIVCLVRCVGGLTIATARPRRQRRGGLDLSTQQMVVTIDGAYYATRPSPPPGAAT